MANLPITGAYCWLNTVSGKRYVGGAYKSLKGRKLSHLEALRSNRHGNRYLQHAWNKYGESAFKFIVLEICRRDKETIIACEQKWIDYYNTADPKYGYNICPKAASCIGMKMSREAKRKISVAHSTNQNCIEARKKVQASNVGKKRSDESKAKMSKAKLGKKLGQIRNDKSRKGVKQSDKIREKLSSIMIGNTRGLGIKKRSKVFLSKSQIMEVRRLYSTGQYSQSSLGKMFNVNSGTICRIVRDTTVTKLLQGTLEIREVEIADPGDGPPT